MTAHQKFKLAHLKYAIASSIFLIHTSGAIAQEAPIVHPGAPGQASRTITADEAIEIANNSYSHDDVQFMQDMIPHHNQAVQMAALVADRTNREELLDVAGRIDASQKDEIEFMQNWLAARNEDVPEPTAHDGMHTTHKMAGMASPEQMADLAAARGTDFDRMFLTLMIRHHEGAIDMVEHLLDQPGSAYDPVLYEFVNDVNNDQESEVERMSAVLASLSDDPRVNLKPGFMDAGQAIHNLALVASLPKPAGFFDPANPAGLPPIIEDDEDEAEEDEAEAGAAGEDAHHGHDMMDAEDTMPAEADADMMAAAAGEGEGEDEGEEADEEEDKPKTGKRSPLLSFSNTDMAFSGNKMVAGNYHGFNVYQLQDDGVPKHFSSIVCPGGQGDVSIVGDLLIMSVEQTRGRVDCGLQGVDEDVSEERFRGIRIFDISDIARPVQVGQVQTCRGSHTHSVVSGPGEDGVIVVYNSGTSRVRDEEELEGCVGNIAGDDRTALFRIDVIEIPVDDPSKSRIVDSPAVFADPETGRLAGLWQGGDHGDDTQDTSQTNQCHDITVFPENNMAAGACSGNGIIFDITDPRSPQRIDEVVDAGFAYWHSATFNNDGTKVIFTDEWGGGGRPRCQAHDPKTWGADAIYDIVDGKLQFRSYFKLPAPQSKVENCVAHNGSVIPVPGRDIFVQAWYQGGISVIDFTDSENPVEIAFFDRGPVDKDHIVTGGYWSTYFYDGKIYGTEIARGIDVLSLLPSEHLSENEIAAAALANQGDVFNPQQQLQVTWPAEPVVARAYMDQLSRSGDLAEGLKASLSDALDQAEAQMMGGGGSSMLADQLQEAAASIPTNGGDATSTKRLHALSRALQGIAGRLR